MDTIEKRMAGIDPGDREKAEAGTAEQIAQAVGELCGDGYEVKAVRIPRNNGVIECALMVRGDGQQASPLIYLSRYLEQHQAGYPLDGIAESIYHTVMEIGMLPENDFGGFEQLLDFQKVKGRIIYQVVNSGWNGEMLKGMPHKQLCGDLAVIFSLLLKQGKGQVVAKVTNQHMERWGTSLEELWGLAETNTPKLQPVKLVSLQDILKGQVTGLALESGNQLMKGIAKEEQEPWGRNGDSACPLYVLTNEVGLWGAAAILYPGALKWAAGQMGGDLLIFPSSIHETILLKREEYFDLKKAAGIVAEINQTEVLPEEVLSDTVYYYSQLEGRMGTASELWDKMGNGLCG